MSTDTNDTQFRIRVYLPTGYTCTLNLFGKSTFAELREQCWQKKSKDFGCQKPEARFRLYTTALFFSDTHTISYLVSIYPAFEGLGTVDRYSLLLESPPEKGDRVMRERMKVDGKKPIFWQGHLLKCSKSTGRGFWKKQYMIFQNQTLMIYQTQEEFTKGKKAHKYIAMGATIPQLDHRACHAASKKFALVFDVADGQGSKSGIHVIAATSEAVLRSFVGVITKFIFFKKCAMVLNILPWLYRDAFPKKEGLFRIAGDASRITEFQHQISRGEIPDFERLIRDETVHIFTGLLKRQLRFMLSPIIPETHYEAFIDIGRQLGEDKRVEQLSFAIKSLAATSVVVLAELFKFLHFACQFEALSKMGALNFAIVIGPNVLRTEGEVANPMKAVEDNKHMQTVISTMILHFDKILPSQSDLYAFDKATNSKWRYGVVNASTSPRNHDPRNSILGGAGGGGLFAMASGITKSPQQKQKETEKLQKTPTRKKSASVAIPKGGLITRPSEINRAQGNLRSAKPQPPPPKIPQSSSEAVDFRSVLKKKTGHSSHQSSGSGHQHTMDWKSKMVQKKVPGTSGTAAAAASTGPPQVPKFGAAASVPTNPVSSPKRPEPPSMSFSTSELEDDEKGPEPASSPRMLPPPNPIQMMSQEDQQRLHENQAVVNVFAEFEDQMAQYDEEIDFNSQFTESISSQIMELAENRKIQNAAKYVKQMEQKCRFVANAAKAHSQALADFNSLLQKIYSQMEEEKTGDAAASGPGAGNGAGDVELELASADDAISQRQPAKSMKAPFSTPGGFHAEHGHSHDLDDNGGPGGPGDGGGLPKYHNAGYSVDLDDEMGSKAISRQATMSSRAIAAEVNDGLPRYASLTDVKKSSSEPDKKVAKALFDYPGGYRSKELTFHRGTTLIITKEKDGWTFGHYELEPTLTGWFPASYVNIISG